eukprot:CAMPEP_0119051172 /NCGR_PEP_ID=MMETSP1177-20130426/72879_1 /TAXON_ID=2985 /ORGANISM="Ochromonas sp, Strain CCMP1899" /LENGTH=194 /DNA_ID=CAMNT_0007030289 /DNA_START=28 /DNA_END=612 /DNA_ORIENTATION=+
MVGFLDWKYLDKEQIRSLEIENEPEIIKRKLEEYMNIKESDQRKRDIAVDFHLFNFTFCKDQAFDDYRTSTFMSIMAEIFNKDTSTHDPIQSRTHSFETFQQLMLKHSIHKPPISIQVFDESDLEAILKYVIESYYRQFNLYKYVFSPRLRLIIKQVLPLEIEQPSLTIFPLNSGFLLSNPVPLESTEETEMVV